jgi:DNA-binding HxlR family transcriptional regulator
MSTNQIDECAANLALKILGRKWTLYIVCELLMNHRLYFGQLQEEILGNYGEKISARVLSESLSRLEENGLLQRTEHRGTTPTRVSYSLTDKGEDLIVIFAATKGWGLKWGGIEQKKCRSFSCIHNTVPTIDIDEVKNLFSKEPLDESFLVKREEG